MVESAVMRHRRYLTEKTADSRVKKRYGFFSVCGLLLILVTALWFQKFKFPGKQTPSGDPMSEPLVYLRGEIVRPPVLSFRFTTPESCWAPPSPR